MCPLTCLFPVLREAQDCSHMCSQIFTYLAVSLRTSSDRLIFLKCGLNWSQYLRKDNSLPLLDSWKCMKLFLTIRSHKTVLSAMPSLGYRHFILSPWKGCSFEYYNNNISKLFALLCYTQIWGTETWVEQIALKYSLYLQTVWETG